MIRACLIVLAVALVRLALTATTASGLVACLVGAGLLVLVAIGGER